MARDRTAQTGPLTIGQEIVGRWESGTGMSEPADLAEAIDRAIASAMTLGWNCAMGGHHGDERYREAVRDLQLD